MGSTATLNITNCLQRHQGLVIGSTLELPHCLNVQIVRCMSSAYSLNGSFPTVISLSLLCTVESKVSIHLRVPFKGSSYGRSFLACRLSPLKAEETEDKCWQSNGIVAQELSCSDVRIECFRLVVLTMVAEQNSGNLLLAAAAGLLRRTCSSKWDGASLGTKGGWTGERRSCRPPVTEKSRSTLGGFMETWFF